VGSHFVWHDSSEDFLYTSYDATWLIYTWDMTHSRVTWLIGSLSAHIIGYHLAHLHIGHDSLIRRTWLIHMWWWIRHTYIQPTYLLTYIRTCMHPYIHTCPCIHTYIYEFVRASIITYMWRYNDIISSYVMICGGICDNAVVESSIWLHSDRKNLPPRGGFLFTMFPDQEAGGRGPPSKNLYQVLRGVSSLSGFLIREHTK